MNLVWLPQAQADIQRLYHFLLEREPRAAERAIRAIQLGAQRLLEFPRIGRRMDDATERRELYVPFGASAYVLRYRPMQTPSWSFASGTVERSASEQGKKGEPWAMTTDVYGHDGG